MENRLPGKVIYSYGLANLSVTLIMTLLTSYYAFFLTDVMMIAVAHITVIMSITQIVNIVSFPLSGIIIFHQTGDCEKYDPEINKPSGKMSIADMFTQIFRNSQLLILMAADCMVFVGSAVATALAVYYYKYVAGGEVGVSFLTFALLVIALISYLTAPYVIIKFGKKNICMFLISLGVLCFIYLRIFGESSAYTFKGIFYVGGILTGLLSFMRQAMYMDISEFGFYKIVGAILNPYCQYMF